jgi:hypothetical protein
MRLVIDTNQAARVPAVLPAGCAGLTLSPFLLAEVLLRGERPRIETLALLSRHEIVVGVQPSEMLDLVGISGPDAIAELTPFPAPNSELDRLSHRLLNEMDYRAAAAWARKVKASHLRMCGDLVSLSDRARKVIKRKRIRRLADFSDALAQLAEGADSFLGSTVNTTVRHKGRRALVVQDADALYAAVMKNCYLRRYFYTLLYYIVSISRLWRHQPLNRDPASSRDDWSDLALSLYVGDDDVVVSNDALVRQAFAAIDKSIQVVEATGIR